MGAPPDWSGRLVAAWRGVVGRAGGEAPPTEAESALLVEAAATLSGGLTRDRPLVGERYLDDPALLGAYLTLYWPVSHAQAHAILGELDGPLGRVLDVGAGPGPLSVAALDRGATSVTALDPSGPALAALGRLAPVVGRRRWRAGEPLPDGPFDTILAGHVLNELWPGALDKRVAFVESLRARLAPAGRLVIVEPALRETSRALLALRDALVAAGAAILAPCLYRGACPALAREGDWCHAERPWHAPPVVEALAARAKLHRDALKMSYLVVAAPGAAWPEVPEGRLFRVVSEPLDVKGQARRIGCGPEGRVALGLARKHVGPANAAFETLARGDVVRLGGEPLQEKGDGLRLGAGTTVEVVAPASAPVPGRK